MTTKTNTPKGRIRGGKREGAGRPRGTGRYGEPTKAIRIPQSLVTNVQQFLASHGQHATLLSTPHRLPLYEHKVAAGFLSPAEDYVDTALDLNEYLIKNPATTFYVRVEGDSMIGAGIHPDDLLMVDRGLSPQHGNIVIAVVNAELTVKRLSLGPQNSVSLVPENDKYPVVTLKEGMDFRIWGVVTNVIHSLRP